MSLFLGLILLVGALRNWITRKTLNSFKYHSFLTKSAIHTSRRITELLRHLRERVNAGRVGVWQFHNGDVFVMADHSWKVSATHETVADGVTKQARDNQNILASRVIDWIDPIITGETEHVPGCELIDRCHVEQATCPLASTGHLAYKFVISDMRPCRAKYMAQDQGVGAAYVVPLRAPARRRDPAGAVMGFLSLHFRTLSDLEAAEVEKEICEACRVAEEIEFLLHDACAMKKRGLWGYLRRSNRGC